MGNITYETSRAWAARILQERTDTKGNREWGAGPARSAPVQAQVATAHSVRGGSGPTSLVGGSAP